MKNSYFGNGTQAYTFQEKKLRTLDYLHTIKPVLSGHPRRPLNTGWPFNTGSTEEGQCKNDH